MLTVAGGILIAFGCLLLIGLALGLLGLVIKAMVAIVTAPSEKERLTAEANA